MQKIIIFVLLGVLIASLQHAADGKTILDRIPNPLLTFLDKLKLDWIPQLLQQKPNSWNGTAKEFRDFALEDEEDASLNWMTVQELVLTAGYKLEDYKAVADDGYITTLTRIINPLADRRKLKWPPVLLMHGGTIDPTAYLFASTEKHHPEKYPRTAGDGPITSWNRSLAFVLANNGYDVWLAETRGANEFNLDHINTFAFDSIFHNKNTEKNMTIGENIQELIDSFNYWAFSMDDIIEHEIKSQIDKICQVIASEIGDENKCKVNLFSFSLSTPLALGFLSSRPDYAKEKIHRFVMMAPTFYREGTSRIVNFALTYICPLIPNSFGTMLMLELVLSELRKVLLIPTKIKNIRYREGKLVTTIMMGPSAKYRTLLEQNVLFHVFRAFGFKQAKQMCQQMKHNRLQKYDYGVSKNLAVYNSTTPPAYDFTNLLIKPYLMVSATEDAISGPRSVKMIIEQMNPKPHRHVVAPQFNHLDLVAAAENDKYVNLPILNYFNEFAEQYPIPGKSVANRKNNPKLEQYEKPNAKNNNARPKYRPNKS